MRRTAICGEIKGITDTLLGRGLTNLSVSGLAAITSPIYLKFNLPDNGKIGKIFRVVRQILGKSNQTQELISEVATYLLKSLMNFKRADLPAFPTVHGPDFFDKQQNSGLWGIFEAKGGTSRLNRSTSHGSQMGHDWIRYWYEKLGDDNASRSADGQQLNLAYGLGTPIAAVVVSLNLNRKKDELKLGFQPWTPNPLAFERWRGF